MGTRITRLSRDNNKGFRHVNMFVANQPMPAVAMAKRACRPQILSAGLLCGPPHGLTPAAILETALPECKLSLRNYVFK
jgi:hypothetical protein